MTAGKNTLYISECVAPTAVEDPVGGINKITLDIDISTDFIQTSRKIQANIPFICFLINTPPTGSLTAVGATH